VLLSLVLQNAILALLAMVSSLLRSQPALLFSVQLNAVPLQHHTMDLHHLRTHML